MTETTDTPTPERMQELPKKQPKFYRHRRIVHPLLMSAAAFVLTAHPFIAFLAYVISGLIWDWFVFTHYKCKDSELLPEFCFEEIGITGKQLDELNDFMVNVRRGALAASVFTSATAFMFLTVISYEMMFILTYIAVTIASMIIATKSGKIISLYRFNNNRQEEYQFSYPWSVIFGPHYNAASDNKINNPFA